MTVWRAASAGGEPVFAAAWDHEQDCGTEDEGGDSNRHASTERLSICYVAPGHNFLASAGPSRNVLSVARELGRWADVSLAFRRLDLHESVAPLGLMQIDSSDAAAASGPDDSAMRGIGYLEFLRYLRSLSRFVDDHLMRFDVVLEKSWLLSGLLSWLCSRRGIAAIPVENYLPLSSQAVRQDVLASLRLGVARRISGYCLRRAPRVIAETEHLRRLLGEHWGVPADRIDVIGLGIDRSLFQPRDRDEARRSLGWNTDSTMLVYVGVLDRAHDLEPVIRAFGGLDRAATQLHIVGDGALRQHFEQVSSPWSERIVFHGRVPHREVPKFIAAADLCLAPYEPNWFAGGEVAYSTLKVREYLSSGRPVVSVPSGSLAELVQHGENGYLISNEIDSWQQFLRDLPSPGGLAVLGQRAARTPLDSWQDVAAAFLAACQRVSRRNDVWGRR